MNMKVASLLNPRLVTILAVLALALTHSTTVVAQEQFDGTISGNVINQTTGQPVSGITVTVSAFTSDGLQAEFTGTTDEHGSFEFLELDTSDGIVYAASVSYRGVLYSTGMIQFLGGVDQTSDIDVFETTTDRSVVGVSTRGVVLSEIDSDSGTTTILDIYSMTVEGEQTFVAGDTGRSVEFPIPRNAGTPTLLPGFDFGTAVVENSILYASSPLRPPGASATISYQLQYTGNAFTLDLLNAYSTGTFRVLIPTDLTAEADSIVVSGSVLDDDGVARIGDRDYHVWTATGLRAAETVRVSFSSLPESSFAPNRLRVAEPTILAGLALVAATALTAIAIRRKKIIPVDELSGTAVMAGFVESREELVLQLQELQDEHENGMIDDELYLSERRNLLERLRIVSHQLQEPSDHESTGQRASINP
jgi:hypothetical protein